MDQESVVLEIDPRSVHAAIVQANKDVESWEKGMVGAGDRMQKSLERMADMLIKMNDRSRSSMERLTQSIEKQAAAYGKTGVDRLVAERDRLIKKLGDEEGMINRVRAAYDKMIAVERASESGGGGDGRRTGFNARYAFFGIKDVMEGRTRFAIAEAANEIMRLRGAALLIGGSVAGVAALGYAAYEVAKGLREIEEEPEEDSARIWWARRDATRSGRRTAGHEFSHGGHDCEAPGPADAMDCKRRCMTRASRPTGSPNRSLRTSISSRS